MDGLVEIPSKSISIRHVCHYSKNSLCVAIKRTLESTNKGVYNAVGLLLFIYLCIYFV